MHPVSQSDQRGVKAALGSPELTPRETEVLFWISQGKCNHDIGVILGAKTGTICKHVGHILSKLNVENRTSAAVVALETRRSVEQTSASKPGEACAAIAGAIQCSSRNYGQAVAKFSMCSRLSSRDAAVIHSRLKFEMGQVELSGDA